MEYAIDVAKACRAHGIKSVAVTAGYMCAEPRREFYRHMDAANVDLKAFTDEFYWKLSGGHLQPVLDTLKLPKHETRVWFETTHPAHPRPQRSDRELNDMTRWVVENLGPTCPCTSPPSIPTGRCRCPPTPPVTLTRARDIALKNGVRYAYTGNVHDEAGGSTYCHRGASSSARRAMDHRLKSDENGACRSCGTICAGVFEARPATGAPAAGRCASYATRPSRSVPRFPESISTVPAPPDLMQIKSAFDVRQSPGRTAPVLHARTLIRTQENSER